MIEITGIKAIVTDIEGTTSSISFVHDVLFPYARKHLAAYVHEHGSEITNILDQVRELEEKPGLSVEEITDLLIQSE